MIRSNIFVFLVLSACGRQLVEFKAQPLLGPGGSSGGTSGSGSMDAAPTVLATTPLNGAVGIALNSATSATFSKAMAPATLVSPANNFTVTEFVSGNAVAGSVAYTSTTATFTPAHNLLPSTKYRSTITLGATDVAGTPLAAIYSWTWTTGDAADLIAPVVTQTTPLDQASNVSASPIITATFSEAMNPATITTLNFLVRETISNNAVVGAVAYDVQNNVAHFSPQSMLSTNTDYTVTITNGATDTAGNPLVVPAVGGAPNPWTFRTAALAINLGTASTYGIASRAGMTSTGVTVVNGDIALTPNPTCTDATGGPGSSSQTCQTKTYASSTGMTVNGSIYFFADPFDNGATAQAVTNDLSAAWQQGKNQAPTNGTVIADQMAGGTFVAGVYHNANLGLAASGVATMDAHNDANATFIFQVDSDFVDSGTTLLPSQIQLVNGAVARNIFFIVGRDVTIGSGTTWNGNILAGRSATVNKGSVVLGRVLAGAGGAGKISLVGAASPPTSITVPP